MRDPVTTTRLRELFDRIEPELYRYPSIDPPSFRRAVVDFLRDVTQQP
jgi:hypothetical protein